MLSVEEQDNITLALGQVETTDGVNVMVPVIRFVSFGGINIYFTELSNFFLLGIDIFFHDADNEAIGQAKPRFCYLIIRSLELLGITFIQ